MSDAPGPFRWKPKEKDEKIYHPYRRHRKPGHNLTATCIDLSNMTNAPVRSFPSSSRGAIRSSSISTMNQSGQSWSVPTTSTIVSTSVVRQHNVPSYEATSSTSSGSNTCTDIVVYNPSNQALAPRSLPSTEIEEIRDEIVPSTLPCYEEIGTDRNSISPNPTASSVTNRVINVKNLIVKEQPNVYPPNEIDSDESSDSWTDDSLKLEKKSQVTELSQSSDSWTDDSMKMKKKPRAAELSQSSDSWTDDSRNLDKKPQGAELCQTSQVKKDSSSDQANEESAERFGSFLASHLKNLTGAERLKAEQQLFECLVKTQSADQENESTKKVDKNKNNEQTDVQKTEPINLDSPEISPKREPLWEEPEPWLGEQEQHSPQQHPFESFLMHESPPTVFPQPTTFSQPMSSQQPKTQYVQSTVHKPTLPYVQSPVPYPPHLMSQLFMPPTTDQQFNYNMECPTISAMAARVAASAVCPASWRQSGRNPVHKPQGGSTRVPPRFPIRPDSASLYDMASQLYHSHGYNAYNFDYKY